MKRHRLEHLHSLRGILLIKTYLSVLDSSVENQEQILENSVSQLLLSTDSKELNWGQKSHKRWTLAKKFSRIMG